MCIFGNNQGATPKPTPVAPPPSTGTVTSGASPVVDASADQSKKALSALNDNRRIVARRQGVFGNIRTSPMGDSTFGSASGGTGYATFGGSRRAA